MVGALDGRFLHTHAAHNAFRMKPSRKKPEKTNGISSAEYLPPRNSPQCTETIRSPMAGDVTFAKIVVKAIFWKIGWGRGLSILDRVGDGRESSFAKMPERFGICIDNVPCGRTMPLLRTKLRRLSAGRSSNWTNSKASYFADQVFNSVSAVFAISLFRIDGTGPVDVRRCCYSERCRRRAFGGNVWRPSIPVPSQNFIGFSQHTKEREWHRDATRFLL